MKYLQFLDFELGRECNLADKHKMCPTSHPERYSHMSTERELDDDTIVEIAVRAYREFEFRGLIGWHYYNEPLLQKERIFRLIRRIKELVPQARFMLWTNGELISRGAQELAVFEKVWITNYRKRNFERVKKIVPQTTIIPARFDKRKTNVDVVVNDRRPCVRPYAEMIVDFYGNVHICCMDWKGLASPGNVYEQSLEEIVDKLGRTRNTVAGWTMKENAPAACKRCNMRFDELMPDFDQEICREQQMHRDWAATWSLPTRDVAVVLTSYKVPTRRLHEHFQWNHAIYEHLGCKVYVVADQEYKLPDYATPVVYPHEMPVFNLAKTSNFGIQHAIKQGHEVIIKSDVDVCFPAEAAERMQRCTDNECIIPLYLMAMNYPERRWNYVPAPKAEGTIVMSADNWDKLRYDERCEGYGAEDGIMVHDINKLKLPINRAHLVWHIAHVPNTPQAEFKGRHDHWGRDTGFNPDKLKDNMQFHPKRRKKK